MPANRWVRRSRPSASSGFWSRFAYIDDTGTAISNNTAFLPTICARFSAYRKILFHRLSVGLYPLYSLVRAQYPYAFPHPSMPPIVSLELSSACNLTCSYCPSPMKVRRVRHMSEQTFTRVIEDLAAMKYAHVHVRGWGEATLNPKFPEFFRKLAQAATSVDIVTNGQWRSPEITKALIEAPAHRIDISIQAGGATAHYNDRGGDIALLTKNIQDLKALREKARSSRTIIVVRLMFRPTQIADVNRELTYWSRIADVAMPAPVFRELHEVDGLAYGEDVFTLTGGLLKFPVCYAPNRHLHVSADGRVPLCVDLEFRKNAEALYVSSVHSATLTEIWNSDRLVRLRHGLRHRVESEAIECKGCPAP